MQLHLIDRQTARAAGLKCYFTGTACMRGNLAERRVSSSRCTCRDCKDAALVSDTKSRERSRLWREANQDRQKSHERSWRDKNRDKEAQRLREFHTENPEKRREYSQRCYSKNRDKILAKKRAYYRENPHMANVFVVSRRAAKLQRTPQWLTNEHKGEIVAIYKEAARRRRAGEDVEVDHIVPLVGDLVSGLHVPWNLEIITAIENRKKNNRFVP